MAEQAPPIRVVIADDHPIFRDGLRRLLAASRNSKSSARPVTVTRPSRSAAGAPARRAAARPGDAGASGLEALRELRANAAAGAHRAADGGDRLGRDALEAAPARRARRDPQGSGHAAALQVPARRDGGRVPGRPRAGAGHRGVVAARRPTPSRADARRPPLSRAGKSRSSWRCSKAPPTGTSARNSA